MLCHRSRASDFTRQNTSTIATARIVVGEFKSIHLGSNVCITILTYFRNYIPIIASCSFNDKTRMQYLFANYNIGRD